MQISTRTNKTATSTARNANETQAALKKSMEQLATGLRINRAADDAAGMAIASQMTAELNGLTQASRNARDAVSLVQTAEGGMNEVGEMMQRMRSLAVQAGNDTNGVSERSAMQKEINQLQNEITRMTGASEFNGKKLLDGSFQGARFQVGSNAGQEISININGIATPNVDVTTPDNAASALTTLDSSIQALNDQRATLGATQNRLESTIRDLGTAADNTLQSRSRIEDADFMKATTDRARNEIATRASIAILAQANVLPGMAAKLLAG
jgi:flagellin